MIAVPVLLGLLAGASASSAVADLAAVAQRQPVRDQRPAVRHGLSFFAFTLPFLRFVLGFLFATVVLSLRRRGRRALLLRRPAAAVPGGPHQHRPRARTCPCCSASSCCSRRWRTGSTATAWPSARTASFTGLTYTDVNAVLPAKSILAFIVADLRRAVLHRRVPRRVAAARHRVRLLLGTSASDRRHLPGDRAAAPGKSDRGRQGERRTSSATSTRRGRRTTSRTPSDPALPGGLGGRRPRRWQQRASTIASIRLARPDRRQADVRGSCSRTQPTTSSPTPSTSTATRSTASERDAVVAVRELNLTGLPAAQRNWINDHTVYTHGYGFVAAHGNTTTCDGKPQFFESGLPPTGPARRRSSRGSTSARTRRVLHRRAPAGAQPQELDYPNETPSRAWRSTPTPAAAASRSAALLQPAAVRHEVPGAEHPAVRTW